MQLRLEGWEFAGAICRTCHTTTTALPPTLKHARSSALFLISFLFPTHPHLSYRGKLSSLLSVVVLLCLTRCAQARHNPSRINLTRANRDLSQCLPRFANARRLSPRPLPSPRKPPLQLPRQL